MATNCIRRILKVSVFVFITSTLFYCKKVYNTFLLKNETSHEIVIEGYRTNTLAYAAADEIYLNPNSEITVKRRDDEDFDSRTFFSVPFVDSVNIIFDSNRILTVTCFSDTKTNCHPLVRGDLKVTVTEEDYDNAVPIEE